MQAGIVGAECGELGILLLAVASAGSVHSLLDASLLHKTFFEIFYDENILSVMWHNVMAILQNSSAERVSVKGL